jgi:UDP-N-acetylglucosamine transferase subunit ALG13
MDKIAFVTVGSTQFDALVDAVLGSEVIRVLQEHKCTRLVIQAGNSPIHVEDASVSISDDGLEVWRVNAMGLDAEIWRFKPSLELDFRSADLVICHAGEPLRGMIMHCSWLVPCFRLRYSPGGHEDGQESGRRTQPDAPT